MRFHNIFAHQLIVVSKLVLFGVSFQDMSKTKVGIYQKQITSHGGEVSFSTEDATHIIVSDSAKLEILESMFGPITELKSKLVTTSWLRVALTNGRIHDEELYSPAPTPTKKPEPSKVYYASK